MCRGLVVQVAAAVLFAVQPLGGYALHHRTEAAPKASPGASLLQQQRVTVTSASTHTEAAVPAQGRSGGVQECATRAPASHICDPEHLLSPSIVDTQSKALLRLASMPGPAAAPAPPSASPAAVVALATRQQAAQHLSSTCAPAGPQVYVAVLSVPSTGLHEAASELGRRWGALDSNCDNEAVVVAYSTLDRVAAVAATRGLSDRSVALLPAQFTAARHGAPQASPPSPDTAVQALVAQLVEALEVGSDPKHLRLVEEGVAVLLCGLTTFGVLAAIALLVFITHDGLRKWLHVSRFHSCQRKIRRVHELFLSREGEMMLCPCCVTTVSNQPSSKKVKFLCGHCFHMECANKWFLKQPRTTGRCPICTAADSEDREVVMEAGLPTQGVDGAHTPKASSMNSYDETKAFMLKSLQHQYPDIIPQACVDRWSSCHTEIWLSELSCPRYTSIFQKHIWGK